MIFSIAFNKQQVLRQSYYLENKIKSQVSKYNPTNVQWYSGNITACKLFLERPKQCQGNAEHDFVYKRCTYIITSVFGAPHLSTLMLPYSSNTLFE